MLYRVNWANDLILSTKYKVQCLNEQCATSCAGYLQLLTRICAYCANETHHSTKRYMLLSWLLKAVCHSSQNPTRKFAARTFIQSQYLKARAASLRFGFRE